jgi:hypothetical protein
VEKVGAAGEGEPGHVASSLRVRLSLGAAAMNRVSLERAARRWHDNCVMAAALTALRRRGFEGNLRPLRVAGQRMDSFLHLR